MGWSRLANAAFESYGPSTRPTRTMTEFWRVYQHKTEDVASAISEVTGTCEDMEQATSELYGLPLRDLTVLEDGAGQQLLRLKYFSSYNQVTALDYDVIVQGTDPVAYWQVFRNNGSSARSRPAWLSLPALMAPIGRSWRSAQAEYGRDWPWCKAMPMRCHGRTPLSTSCTPSRSPTSA